MGDEITVAGPHWVEFAYWWSQIVLLVVTVGAVIFAACQLRAISQGRAQTARLANATFLLELDRRWESKEITDARKLVVKLRQDVTQLVASNHPLVNDNQRMELFRTEFANTLRQMREQDLDNYLVLLRICGFFETAGLMVKKGYIDAATIISLFSGAIVSTDNCFRLHIQERQKETGVPNGMFEHALYLCDLTRNSR